MGGGWHALALRTRRVVVARADYAASTMANIILPIALLGAMYWFFIRPQQQKAREHADLLKSIGPGDDVMLNSGIYALVTEVNDDDGTAFVEVAPGIELKISRSAIQARIAEEGEEAASDDAEPAAGAGLLGMARKAASDRSAAKSDKADGDSAGKEPFNADE